MNDDYCLLWFAGMFYCSAIQINEQSNLTMVFFLFFFLFQVSPLDFRKETEDGVQTTLYRKRNQKMVTLNNLQC